MRDFGPRYQDTYGYLHLPAGKRLVQIISNNDEAVYFRQEDNGFNFHVAIDSALEFEFLPVNMGFYNTNEGNVYFMQRVAARQWRRGISRNNTAMYHVHQGQFNGTRPSLALLNNIFNSVQDYHNVQTSQDSFALSRHFAVTGDYLFFYKEQIGTRKENVLSVHAKCLCLQELQDCLQRNHANSELTLEITNE